MVSGVVDEEPSGCGNPLGRGGRIVARCYSVTLLVVPFTRRGPMATRRGRMSRPPFTRTATSPIPRGHGLVRGFSCMFVTCRRGWGTSGLAAADIRHGVDGGKGYEVDGVVMG